MISLHACLVCRGSGLVNWADSHLRPLVGPGRYDLIITRMWWGPNYDGNALHETIQKEMEGLTLADTVIRILLPSFDVHLQSVIVIGSCAPARGSPTLVVPSDLPLEDVCIVTTAAPVYFPAHSCEHDGTKYNLIDGGVAANNPTLDAIWSIIREVDSRRNGKPKNLDFHADPTNPERLDFNKCLVISIGTGYAKQKYTAEECSKWGVRKWIYKDGHTPLLDIFSSAAAPLIHLNTGFHFHLHTCKLNYLRINPQVRTCYTSHDGSLNL